MKIWVGRGEERTHTGESAVFLGDVSVTEWGTGAGEGVVKKKNN